MALFSVVFFMCFCDYYFLLFGRYPVLFFWVLFSYFNVYTIVLPFLVEVKLFYLVLFLLFLCLGFYGLARTIVEYAPVATSMLGLPASPGAGNKTGVVAVVIFPVPSCP